MHFDYWQRWGVALDDESFANAWAALGLASPTHRSVKAVKGLKWKDTEVPWSFPRPEEPVEGTPEEWAQAWRGLQPATPLRLRVVDEPVDEPMLPWYRILGEARPAPESVSLHVWATRSQLDLQWPLRLGSLDERSWNVLEAIERDKMWPAQKVARLLQLGREQANCDVLVHRGPVRELLQRLLALPFRVRANVLLAHGGAEDWGEHRSQLSALFGETRASGFVLVPPATGDEALASLLNGLTAELSHALPIDVAMVNAARHGKFADVISGFTAELTAFRLPQVAARLNARLAALPRGTELDLSRVGPPGEWLAKGVEGGGMAGGVPRPMAAAAPAADRHVAAASVRVEPRKMRFDSEIEGGSTLAEMGEAMATAAAPPEVEARRAARFLQQKSFVRPGRELQEAKEGFLAGVPTVVRVRIGAPEEGWNASPAIFPVEDLPPQLDHWNLTVWLTEPEHLPRPLRKQLRLPRDGDSTEADFVFKPRELPRFEGRLSVLHRGRVLQTALLRAGVLSKKYPAAKDGAPRLADEVAVRRRLGALDTRREFDLAFVANHDSLGRPLLTSVSKNAAWVKDLSNMHEIAGEINASLTPVAKSVKDYVKGLDGEKGEAVLVQLAQHGVMLRRYLRGQIEDPNNNPAPTKADYIQIVSTKIDSVVPLEFLYEYTVPEDGAKVCRGWRKAVADGRCGEDCKRETGKIVCPMGFWGVSKVIERHAVTPGLKKDGNELYIQSEPDRKSSALYLGGSSVLGASKRVEAPDLAQLAKILAKCSGAPPRIAKDWTEWAEIVTTHRPALLVALPHTDGRRTNVTVEIGSKAVKTNTLREAHVFPLPPKDGQQAPLVALLGCDVAGTADDYGNHVLVFRDLGAAIVIGTIATVFGGHAAKVAGKLVEGMLGKNEKPVRLGELIRDVRRAALLDNLLMPLCLVAYGDADWILSAKENA